MKKKTSNSSGFTLVELMVVMCLMGIIMGAILNFISPTAELYKNTNTYLSEEEATTTIYNYLQDDLMYATALYIYPSDNDNIDEVAEEIEDLGIDSVLSNPYTDCIVLNNADVRLTGTDAATAKGATGSISKYALSAGRYVDVSHNSTLLSGNNLFLHSFSLMDQSFMEDDSYIFGISHNTGSAISVLIDVYTPAYSSSQGQYVFRENSYSAQKSIEFINASVNKMSSSPIYASSVMDQDNPTPYVYIFYGRKPKIQANAGNINYTCYLMDHDGNWEKVAEGSGPEGSDINDDVFKAVEEYNISRIEKNGYVYQRKNVFSYAVAVDDYDPDAEYYDLHNLTGNGAKNIQLYMVYSKTALGDMPQQYVNFYVDDGPPQYSFSVDYGEDFDIDAHPEVMALLNETVYGGDIAVTEIWANKDTLSEYIDYTHITDTLNLYIKSYNSYLIRYYQPSGAQIYDWEMSDGTVMTINDYYYVREGNTITEYPDLTPYETDTETCVWLNLDLDEEINDAKEIRSDWVLKPEEPENPGGNPGENPGGNPGENPGGNPGGNPGENPGGNPGGNPGEGDITGGSVDVSWGYAGTDNVWTDRNRTVTKNKITITNNSGQSLPGGSTITLLITYNCTIENPPYGGSTYNADWNCGNPSVTYSIINSNTMQVVIKFADTPNSWDPTFDNGEYIIFNAAVLYDETVSSPAIVSVMVA